MQIVYSQSEAHSLSLALITARLVAAVAIDGIHMGNSGWICIVIGFLLNLPLAMAVDKRPRAVGNRGGAAGRIAGGVLGAVAIYECAALVDLIIEALHYNGLMAASSSVVAFFILLCCFYAICKNGDGVCNACRIWIFIFALLFAMIFISQGKLFEPRWLLPIAGPGFASLGWGAVTIAGYQASAAMIHSLATREDKRSTSCLASLTVSSLAAIVLCLLRGMLAPAFSGVEITRILQFDTLLSNGRESLALQLPLLITVYSGTIAALAGYSLVAAGNLQRLAKGANGRICGVVALIFAFGLFMAKAGDRKMAEAISHFEFIAIGLGVFTMLLSGTYGIGKAQRAKGGVQI